MKILFLITGLGMGGAENLVVNIADLYCNQGHCVKIIYLTGDLKVRPDNDSINIVYLGLNGFSDILSAFNKLKQHIANFKPDVIHSHMYHANIMARLMRITTKIPKLICTAHSTTEGGFFRTIMYRLTDFLADISTNVSTAAVESFISKGAVSSGRMLSVPNGVNTDFFKFSQTGRDMLRQRWQCNDKFVILSVGRLYQEKGYSHLLAALSYISQHSDIPIQLKIVGDGPMRNQILGLISTNNLEDKVELLGIRHDIPELLSACDIFVLPSEWEGFGLVVAEAMSCKRLVVATDCGGVKEVVGEHGILVQPGDSHGLANGILSMLNIIGNDSATYKGEEARLHIVDKFSLNKTAMRYMNLYSGL